MTREHQGHMTKSNSNKKSKLHLNITCDSGSASS